MGLSVLGRLSHWLYSIFKKEAVDDIKASLSKVVGRTEQSNKFAPWLKAFSEIIGRPISPETYNELKGNESIQAAKVDIDSNDRSTSTNNSNTDGD